MTGYDTVEIGRAYGNGNKKGQKGEPITIEFDPTVHYHIKNGCRQFNPVTKEDKELHCPCD